MKIALVGPDGAGKSSVCIELNKKIPDSKIVHVVKDREHNLRIMSLVVYIWKKIPLKHKTAAYLYKYTILYFFELFENLYRFKCLNSESTVYLYDRHPLDRIMNFYEFKYIYTLRMLSKYKFCFHSFFTMIWSQIYCRYFSDVDCIIFLLPAPELSFERSGGQYINLDYARARVAAYWKTSKVYGRNNHIIYIGEGKSVLDITEIILSKI